MAVMVITEKREFYSEVHLLLQELLWAHWNYHR